MFINRRGQNTLEYALVISVIIAALLAINTYIKRGVQGRLKESSDQIGSQFDPEDFTTAWKTESEGETKTQEKRDVETGSTASITSQAETITKSEYEQWGSSQDQHY